jgi:hypothetical protein
MSDSLLDPFGLGEGPATTASTAETPPPPPAMGGHHPALPMLVLIYLAALAVVTSLTGLGLLLAMLAPSRQERAAARIAEKPVASFLLGAVCLLVPLGALHVLFRHHLRIGRGFLVCLLIVGVVCGLATCARALGARALPGRPPIMQTALGLGALALALVAPPGWLAALIAIPLGLGAWITARRA